MKKILFFLVFALGLASSANANMGWECTNTTTGLSVVVRPPFYSGGNWPGSVSQNKSNGIETIGSLIGVDFNAPLTGGNNVVFTSREWPVVLSISRSPLPGGANTKHQGHVSGTIKGADEEINADLICVLKSEDTI